MSDRRDAEPPPEQPPGNKNERAFAILAPPERIWRTLLREVHAGVEGGRAEIVRQNAPRGLVVNVRIGWGLGVRYDYRLRPTAQHTAEAPETEVAVTVDPYGMRHALANLITLGRAMTPHMLAATQGLANLKQVVEGESQVSS